MDMPGKTGTGGDRRIELMGKGQLKRAAREIINRKRNIRQSHREALKAIRASQTRRRTGRNPR